jgi:hypothetical protein
VEELPIKEMERKEFLDWEIISTISHPLFSGRRVEVRKQEQKTRQT